MALAISIGAVACQKDFDETLSESEAQGGTQITFNIDAPETKVEVNGVEVTWNDGDEMMFFNSNSGSVIDGDILSATVNPTNSKSVGFSGTVTPTSGNLCGFYPASGAHINNGDLYLSSMLRLVQPLYIELGYDADGAIDPKSLAPYSYMFVKSNESLSDASVDNSLTGTIQHLMAYLDLDLKIPSGKRLERLYISFDTVLATQSIKVDANTGAVTTDQYVDYMVAATGSAWHAMDYMILELTGSDGEIGTAANSEDIVPVRIPFVPQKLSGKWTLFATYSDNTESIQKIDVSKTLSAGIVYSNPTAVDFTQTSNSAVTPKIGDFYYSDDTYSVDFDDTKSDLFEGIVFNLHVNGVDTTINQIYSPYAIYTTYLSTDYCPATTYWNFVSTANVWNNINKGLQNMITIANHVLVATDANYAEFDDYLTANHTYAEIFKVGKGFEYAFNMNGTSSATSQAYMSYQPYNGTALTGEEDHIWHLGCINDYMVLVNDTAMLQGGNGDDHNFYKKQELKMPTSITGSESYHPIFGDEVTNYGTSGSSSSGRTFTSYVNDYYTANTTNLGGNNAGQKGASNFNAYYRPIKRVMYEKSGDGDIFVPIQNDPANITMDTAPSTSYFPVGTKFQFAATLYDAEGSSENTSQENLKWRLTGDTTTGSSISSTGLFTAGTGSGSVTVEAYANGFESISSTFAITVFESSVAVEFSGITDGSVTVDMTSDTATYTSSITKSASVTEITYKLTAADGISDTSIATVDADGVVTATSAGTVILTVTAKGAENGFDFTDSDSVTIAFDNGNIMVDSITISNDEIVNGAISILIGNSATFTATALPELAGDTSVTWSIAAGDDAVVSLDATTATIKAVATGTATLTATANDGSGIYESVTINVVSGVSTPDLGDGGDL